MIAKKLAVDKPPSYALALGLGFAGMLIVGGFALTLLINTQEDLSEMWEENFQIAKDLVNEAWSELR